MIQQAYVMLVQEPWCYTPEQIGRLTDWQIEHLYARPAAKRAEEFQRDLSAPGGLPRPPSAPPAGRNSDKDLPEPGTPAHRNLMIHSFMNGPFAMSREKAVAMYESQLAAWRAEQE